MPYDPNSMVISEQNKTLGPMDFLRMLGQNPGMGQPTSMGMNPPGPSVAPVQGAQIPGGAVPDVTNMGAGVPGPVAGPMPAPAAPFMPQLPPMGAAPPPPKPLSIPQVEYYPTKGGARAANILGALGGFREGAQKSRATEDQRLANKGKLAYAQIQSISASGAPDAQEKIAKIVADPEVQQGLRLIGVELPMMPGTESKGPGGIKGVLGKVMGAVSGVPQRQPTGKVDVGAMPQMDPAKQAAMKLQQAQLGNALYEEQVRAALPQEAKDLLVKAKLGLALSPADQAKLDALTNRAMEEIRLKHQNAVDLQTQKDKAAMERTKVKPQAEQPLANEMADLETKVASGTATPADRLRLEAIKKTRTLSQQTTYVLGQEKRDASEQAIEIAAQSLAKGDLTNLRDIASLRNDQRILIFARAKQLNPNFSTSELQRKIKMEDAFTNGQDGKNLQSFGTFMEHAGELSDAVNDIRLTNTPLINKPINWLRQNAAGDPAIHRLLTAIEPVGKEYETFLLNNRALYEDDRKSIQGILNGSLSPAQMQAALKQVGVTAKDRANEANFRYKKVMGHDLQEPFSPEALAAAKKIGVDLTMGGRKAAADAIVQQSPSTGQFRYSTDGGKTWQSGKPPQ